jgi:hypothetical protein
MRIGPSFIKIGKAILYPIAGIATCEGEANVEEAHKTSVPAPARLRPRMSRLKIYITGQTCRAPEPQPKIWK